MEIKKPFLQVPRGLLEHDWGKVEVEVWLPSDFIQKVLTDPSPLMLITINKSSHDQQVLGDKEHGPGVELLFFNGVELERE